MVREDALSDSLNLRKPRYNRNVTTTPPRYDKKQRGKSADRAAQRSLGARQMSAHGLNDLPPGSPRINAKIMKRRQSVYHSSEVLNNMKPSAVSMNSLSSNTSNHGQGKDLTPPAPHPDENSTLYEKLVWSHQYDPRSKEEVIMNRRVGFYKFKSDLGAGNFSKVKLAHHQLTKERVAVKIIDKSKLEAKTQKMVNREISIMDSLSHPNLIRLFEVTETISGIYLMMEYAPGGELFVRIAECGSYTEMEAKPIFAQIASAVQYMHDRHFIHRDLKAENVFFAQKYATPNVKNGKQLPSSLHKNGYLNHIGVNNVKRGSMFDVHEIQVKVGDFGFATQVSKLDQHLMTFCGSPPYAAPELFQDDHYIGPSVDIWALGILLYLMVTGSMPFKGATVAELKNAILDGHFAMPDYLSSQCADLIAGILKRKADWRLTLQQIRESHWLNGIDWPEADHEFRSMPLRVPFETSELTEAEAKTREVIKEIGIDETLLESHIEKGPRSHVIGAFRIAQHKFLNDLEHSGFNSRRTSKTSQNGWARRISTPASVQTEKLERIQRKGVIEFTDEKPNKKNKKSKLCLIL